MIAVGTVAELQQLEELFTARLPSRLSFGAILAPWHGEFTLRHFRYAIAAFVVAYVAGAIAFWATLDDGPLDALYRSTVTISLTGLDTPPGLDRRRDRRRSCSSSAGMAIYAYIAGALVELVARGVLTGAWSDRRRRR